MPRPQREPWHYDQADPRHQDAPTMPPAYLEDYTKDRRQIVADQDPEGGREWIIMHGATVEAEGYEASLDECIQVMRAALSVDAQEAWDREIEEDQGAEP